MERLELVIHPRLALARLPEADLVALAAELQLEAFAAGDVLLTEGEQDDRAFIILDGEIQVTSLRAGNADDLAQLGPGEPVGLLSMIYGAPRSAGARAASDVRVATLTRAGYDRLAGAHPRVTLALQLALGEQLARDVRALTGRVAEALDRRRVPGADEHLHDYDVVVIGAGYVGISYASWVKKQRPDARIAVVDKRGAPGYKIGESSLGPTVRNLVSLGIPMPVLRRLFHVKLELSFWWTGTDSDDVGVRMSPGFFDESFQFERRVLEMLMTTQARRLGVDVFEGMLARARDSDIEGPVKELLCQGSDGSHRFRYKILCDASGPASVVPRTLGLYTKKLDGLNANAYYGYFTKKRDPDVIGWDNASTRHLCFADGWVWFIQLASWQKSPDDKLQALIDHLLDLHGPDEDYPDRRALADQFGCHVEEIFSIGVVPRSDTDESTKLPVEERFQHYVDKYPGFKRVMDCFEVIEDGVYPGHRAYSAFMHISHDSERVAGDSWLAIGDAAFFVNPLWSPGLAYGSGGSFVAAQDTVAALADGDFSRDAFANYQNHAKMIFKRVFRENEMFYRSYAHPVSYERVTLWRNTVGGFAAMSTLLERLPPGAPRPPVDRPFPDTRLPGDPVFGAVTFPMNIETVDQVVDLMRRGERDGSDAAETAAQVKAVIDSRIGEMIGSQALEMSLAHRRIPHYTAGLDRDEGIERDPLAKIWRCPNCRNGWNRLEHSKCHVCGEHQAEGVRLEN